MNHHALVSRRRALVALLAVAGSTLALGCQGDDTVRGAGSIDIPVDKLEYKVEPKNKKGKAKG